MNIIRKIKCKLGYHDWYRLFPFVIRRADGSKFLDSECKCCNAIGNSRELEDIKDKEIWWKPNLPSSNYRF